MKSMELRIIRTDHQKLCCGRESRNYHVKASVSEYSREDAIDAMKEFHLLHKPAAGPCNILLYTSEWAAKIDDYRMIIGSDYIRLADEHNYMLVDTEMTEPVIMDYPLHDKVYDALAEDFKYYAKMTWYDIQMDLQEKAKANR